MNENQSAFNTAKQTAQKVVKCQNDQEVMDFLSSQDLHTLNLLKYYYSAPSLSFQLLMKIAFSCIVMALIFTSFLFIQVKSLIPVPILSDLLPAAFSLFTIGCIVMFYMYIAREKNSHLPEKHITRKAYFVRIVNMIDMNLRKKYDSLAAHVNGIQSNHTIEETVQQITACRNDEELMRCLEKQDTNRLCQLKAIFSKPVFSLYEFMKWIFIGSIIAVFLTALFSGQVSYIHIPSLFPYLLLFLFVRGLIYLIKLLQLYQKGPLHSISQFARNAEHVRVTDMIDFVLEQKYKETMK
ncbi:hypothetical protein J7E26_12015 [Bacillus sp. ISL-51]|uniref:hypothetical protein n=1 Tax=Bacteria TaxID=2 RepID=UPI001BE83213|nr:MULTISPECIES: hypothetical protein [Bacteria]MBT2574677.1 hypothetical protein [Bacillus sp. ISL-51]MBT2636242.1 hypothetical protein [Bacillus sp. ISL-26]MBT2711286.1 hypothetical protein [Pseudomonas sp. ISL-88]